MRLVTYVYIPKAGHSVTLYGSPRALNLFLREELSSAVAGSAFLENQLPRFLLSTMAPPHCDIIDEKFVNAYASRPKYAKGQNDAGEPAVQRSGKDDPSLVKLRGYQLDPKAVVVGDKWHLEFNIGTESGGIERWYAAGIVFPLQIIEFRVNIMEPDHAFAPEIQSGVLDDDAAALFGR
jgi:hypothetical protein